MAKQRKETLHMVIDAELKAKLAAIAQAENRSLANLIETVLKNEAVSHDAALSLTKDAGK